LGLINQEIKAIEVIKIRMMYFNVSPPGIIFAKTNAYRNNNIPPDKEK